GDNVTVDVFEYKIGEKSMDHVKTVTDWNVYSADGLALLGDGAFVLTNDHSAKDFNFEQRKELDMILGGGNVVRCTALEPGQVATHNSLRFLNSLARGHDGLIYVPSLTEGFLRVYQLERSGKLREVDQIPIGIQVDNLFAACLTSLVEVFGALGDPPSKHSTSSIFRICKTDESYETVKVVENRGKRVLSGAFTATHDVRTGRLF
ncbi:uncharacterized protein BDR25DRAFT_163325, partial [Lindgomyces ingoldianus]